MVNWLHNLKNPFERLAGWPALGLGLAAMALTAWLGLVRGIWFDGVLNVSAAAAWSSSPGRAFLIQGIDWGTTVLCMALAGLCFARSRFRLIDVAGTMAFARLPMLALVALLPVVPSGLMDLPRVVIFAGLALGAVVWMVVWMYQGYSVSCRVTGARGIWSFAGALLVAEVISKLLIFWLLLGGISSSFFTPENKAASQEAMAIPEEQTIQQTAALVIKAFETGKFNEIAPYFDETMQKGLPAGKLALLWLQLQGQYGAFVKADTQVEATGIDELRVLQVPCEFKQQSVRLRFTFNPEGRISGLYVRPIEKDE